MRRKITLILMTLILSLTLIGCQKKEKPLNYDRGTDYQFDFINLIEMNLYGSNGRGFIEVRPKDLKLGDKIGETEISEKDLISLMRYMDDLGLYVGPDTKIPTNLMVSNNYGLSNGDVVTLFVADGFTSNVNDISVNIEPFQWKVDGLPEGTVVDLFNEKSVIFYGLEGTKNVYPLKLTKGSIPQEVYDYLIYTAKVEGDQTVQEGKTILQANAEIDKGVLEGGNDPAFTTDVYLGRRSLVADTYKEKILTKVVPQLNINAIDNTAAQKAIKDYLENQTILINDKVYSDPNVTTLQVKKDSIINTHVTSDYTTTFKVNGSDGTLCLALPIRLVSVDGVYMVPETRGNMQAVNMENCGSTMSDYTMIANYNAPIIEPELPSNEEAAEGESQQEQTENQTETQGGGA